MRFFSCFFFFFSSRRRHTRSKRDWSSDVCSSDLVNVLGLTFKEDVPDIRNSKVIDIIRELHEFGVETFVHDPQASPEDALHEYGVRLADWDSLPAADALILAVSHRRYLEMPTQTLLRKVVRAGCIIDVKSVLDAAALR